MVICSVTATAQDQIKIIEADHHYIQYYGRFDKTNPKLPRVWAPGATVVTRFSGGDCEVFVNDQVFGGGSHNYIEVKVDNIDPVRIQLRAKANRIQIAKDLPGGDHTVTITKNTDASVGFIEIRGFNCASLLPPPPVPTRKLEFIGDDVVAGVGADSRYTPCDSAEWYDQSSAYSGFAAVAARDLNAQLHISATAGVGVLKSAGEPGGPISVLFDKTSLYKNDLPWDFKRYVPDLVVISLGQNDALNDSLGFIAKYAGLVSQVRTNYPSAQIVCMAITTGEPKSARIKNFLPGVIAAARQKADTRVHALVVNGVFGKGCSKLPDMGEHLEIASQLEQVLKKLMAW
jgi:hypothetical protein